MKNFSLMLLFVLVGCSTYQPAQDVYYDDASVTQPAIYTVQPTVYTSQPVIYTTPSTTYVTPEQSQVFYVTDQPTTSVIYVNEPIYYEPVAVQTPPHFPPHHFRPEPLPPHKAPSKHKEIIPLPKHYPVQPEKHNIPPRHKP